MEEQKELQEHKGQERDVGENGGQKDQKDGYREKDQVFIVRKKTEKLTTAMYLITDLLNESEPLKWELRKEALSLLSLITATTLYRTDSKDSVMAAVRGKIFSLTSLAELAHRLRLVSTMNFSILRGEYESLWQSIAAHMEHGALNEGRTLSHSFFKITEQQIPQPQTPAKERFKLKEPQRAPTTPAEFPVRNSESVHRQKASRIAEDRERADLLETSNVFSTNDAKDARRDMIIKFLRAKGEASIKDIASVISGCSEKTIQRELVSLIDGNVILRKGERRWSIYSLKASV